MHNFFVRIKKIPAGGMARTALVALSSSDFFRKRDRVRPHMSIRRNALSGHVRTLMQKNIDSSAPGLGLIRGMLPKKTDKDHK